MQPAWLGCAGFLVGGAHPALYRENRIRDGSAFDPADQRLGQVDHSLRPLAVALKALQRGAGVVQGVGAAAGLVQGESDVVAGLGRAVDQPVIVTFTVSNTAVANFGGQASVTQVIPAGGSFASAIINFVGPGPVSVIATATGFVSGQLNFRISQ